MIKLSFYKPEDQKRFSPFSGVVEGTMQLCRCLFWNNCDALFRYFSKCCSDIIDIVPLKWHTISYSNSAKYCIQYDSSEREILCQKTLPCVSTPADFILVFRTLPNRLVCIILLNCYSYRVVHGTAIFLTFGKSGWKRQRSFLRTPDLR